MEFGKEKHAKRWLNSSKNLSKNTEATYKKQWRNFLINNWV